MNKMLSIKPDRQKYAKGDSPSGKNILMKKIIKDVCHSSSKHCSKIRERYELVCGWLKTKVKMLCLRAIAIPTTNKTFSSYSRCQGFSLETSARGISMYIHKGYKKLNIHSGILSFPNCQEENAVMKMSRNEKFEQSILWRPVYIFNMIFYTLLGMKDWSLWLSVTNVWIN